MQSSVKVHQEFKIKLTDDPTILVWGTYPKELKSGSQRGISTVLCSTHVLCSIVHEDPAMGTTYWVKKERKCGVYIQQNFFSALK